MADSEQIDLNEEGHEESEITVEEEKKSATDDETDPDEKPVREEEEQTLVQQLSEEIQRFDREASYGSSFECEEYEREISGYEAEETVQPEASQDGKSSERIWGNEYETEEYTYVMEGMETDEDEGEGEEEEGEGEEYVAPEKSDMGMDEGEKEDDDRSSTTSVSQVYSKLSPFFIKWIVGMRTSTKLINLTKNNRFEVFYASSHFGVLYDYRRNKMRFLPGHNSLICSIASDASGKWLVTADEGEDNVIIIWNYGKRVPCWCLYDIFKGSRLRCVQISQDARFLAAVSKDSAQELKFFLWTYGRDREDGRIELGSENGDVVHIYFNHLDTTQFAVTTETKVAFCKWDPEKKTIDDWLAEVKLRKGRVGTLRETLFLDDNHTAITSTSLGQIVVWSDTLEPDSKSKHIPGTIEKKYLKLIRIHKSGVTSMQLCDGVIVSSSEDGVITFHDQTLRLLYWVSRYVSEPVLCVSCNLQQSRPNDTDPFSDDFDDRRSSIQSTSEEDVEDFIQEYTAADFRSGDSETDEEKSRVIEFADDTDKGNKEKFPSDCTIDGRPFRVRDYVFLTESARFGYVSHRTSKIRYFFREYEAPVISMDCNPNATHLVIGNADGNVSLFDYVTKRILLKSDIAKVGVTYLKYSPSGKYLAAGLENGKILFLDSLTLGIKLQFELGKGKIGKICFTSNETIFAYYDSNYTVYVHKLSKFEKRKTKKWIFMGGYKSHYKPITDIMFDETYDDDEKERHPRLFTIGEDRSLVEYDIKNMQPGDLRLKSIDRIEQTALPKCFILLPKFNRNRVSFLLANNEYKFKLIRRSTRTCAKTTLGPTADSPLNSMQIVKTKEPSLTTKIIYSTERHIGLRLLPSTGNPFEGLGMVAHPEKITALAISNDSRYVFTTGLNDQSFIMWKINLKSVDIAHQLGGTGLEPFMPLIEGGPDGFLFREIQDFFYYLQIIHQGEHANAERYVTKKLALCEVPDLLRSLGYFPTDYEVENIIYETKHTNNEETGDLSEEITFEECVKIYLNHRPVGGISMESINKALLSVADLRDPECIILEKDEFYKSLENRAEAMSHAELIGYLCILLLPKNEKDPIPGSMTLKDFAEDVLGIDLTIKEDIVNEITHLTDPRNSS